MTDTNAPEPTGSAATYMAELIGPNGTEAIELELIDGLPRKSFARAAPGAEDDSTEDVVWELDEGTDGRFRYLPAGEPAQDY